MCVCLKAYQIPAAEKDVNNQDVDELMAIEEEEAPTSPFVPRMSPAHYHFFLPTGSAFSIF